MKIKLSIIFSLLCGLFLFYSCGDGTNAEQERANRIAEAEAKKLQELDEEINPDYALEYLKVAFTASIFENKPSIQALL